jgi:hypothetical protein
MLRSVLSTRAACPVLSTRGAHGLVNTGRVVGLVETRGRAVLSTRAAVLRELGPGKLDTISTNFLTLW